MHGSKCKQRIAIDMSFYEKMSPRDVNRTISQLSFCYAANRRSENPAQLTIAHLEGLQKEVTFFFAYCFLVDFSTLFSTFFPSRMPFQSVTFSKAFKEFFWLRNCFSVLQMFFSNETRHGWDVYIKEEKLSDLYNPEEIVYLTADSENILEKLDVKKVYDFFTEVFGFQTDFKAHKAFRPSCSLNTTLSKS